MEREKVKVIVTEERKNNDKWMIKICCEGESWNDELLDPMQAGAKERLRWSVEDFATYHPFDTTKSQVSLNELQSCGNTLSEVLGLRSRLDGAISGKDVLLDIVERNRDSDFHQVHWEVLEDLSHWKDQEAEGGPASVVVRRIFRSKACRDELPSLNFRMLYVVARPWDDGSNYIDHRLISRTLVKTLDTSSADSVRVSLEIVRPGTYNALYEHLSKSRDPAGASVYHLVHLDMHGSVVVQNGEEKYEFNFLETVKREAGGSDKREGTGEPVKAEIVAKLLKQHKIRAAVLNTCESANARGNATANLAKLFLRHGVRTVVAMSYKLTTNAAELFFDSFYHNLFANGLHYAEAAAAGRNALKSQSQRRARYGLKVSVHDWIVPVCYINLDQNASTLLWTRNGHLFFYHPFTKNLPMTLSYEGEYATTDPAAEQSRSPTNYAEPILVDGAPPIIGRDLDILKLEYKLNSHSKTVLILSGPAGAGKTALAMSLVHWWVRTRFSSKVQYVSCRAAEFNATLDRWVASSSRDSQDHVEGLPWIYIIDHFDEDDAIQSLGEGPSPLQLQLCEALNNLHSPYAKFVLVTRKKKKLIDNSPLVRLLVDESYHVDEFELNGLSHPEAAELGANVLARLQGSVTLDQVPYLRRIYNRVGNLPEGIQWALSHCHPLVGGLHLKDILAQLDAPKLAYPSWPSVSDVLVSQLSTAGNLGRDIFLFSSFSKKCPSIGHWEAYLHFFCLYEQRVLWPGFQTSTEMLRETRDIFLRTRSFRDNPAILESEEQLKALTILRGLAPVLREIASLLESLGLAQVAKEGLGYLSWIHPGLSITLRRFVNLPNYRALGDAVDRAFAYAMVMRHFDIEARDLSTASGDMVQTESWRTGIVSLGRRNQPILKDPENYVRAAQLGRPLLSFPSAVPGPLQFSSFAAYLMDLMRAINVTKHGIEAKVIMRVVKSTLNDFYAATVDNASIDRNDIELSMELLISLGRMNVGGDDGHLAEVSGLIRRAAQVCNVPGLSTGAKATLWAIQSGSGRVNRDQQTAATPSQALALYSRLQEAKDEFHSACRLPHRVDSPDHWLYESYHTYRDQWLEYERINPPSRRLNAAGTLEERLLGLDMTSTSDSSLRSSLSAYARFLAHENMNEQAERCFQIEEQRLARRLVEARELAYDGLEDAMHNGDQQAEYDFRRYILEVHDELPLLEAESHLAHLQQLERELRSHHTLPRTFHVCPCWYPTTQAELAVAGSDPVGTLQHSLDAVLQSILSCQQWIHVQKALCGLQSRTDFIADNTVAFLRLCIKYKFAECPDPISLYDLFTQAFKVYLQNTHCTTGYLWMYDVELMQDISTMLGLSFEITLEKLFRAYTTALIRAVPPGVQPTPSVDTIRGVLRDALTTKERAIFATPVLVVRNFGKRSRGGQHELGGVG
ncbi:hypothetical protein NW761_012918 [Fusarium oxysporum]|nr:hypothetical protein NW758_012228 [Fusarium oxysporum]KAJ4075658.1 hypothetical protein NW761_012918 [Fusarium oxysporum]